MSKKFSPVVQQSLSKVLIVLDELDSDFNDSDEVAKALVELQLKIAQKLSTLL